MLTQNNPQIDSRELGRKLEEIEAERRGSDAAPGPEPAAVAIPQEPPTLLAKPECRTEAGEPQPDPDPLPQPAQAGAAAQPPDQPDRPVAAARRSLLRSAFTWIKNLLRLNARLFAVNAQLSSLHARQEQVQHAVDVMNGQVQAALASVQQSFQAHLDGVQVAQAGLRQQVAAIDARLAELEALRIGPRLTQFDHVNIANRLNRIDALDISSRLNAFDTINIANRLAQIDIDLQRIAEQNRERDHRIAGLVEVAKEATAMAAAVPMPAADGEPARAAPAGMDRFYVEFEAKFRGAPDDIRERLKIYLPYVGGLAADPAARVVDIGCGRGEWLELMREQGVQALGIDMNAAMVDVCRARGLQAEQADAIDWLRRQPAGSIAAISGFHLIEHLPFATLLELFDAALQALRPDGVLIVETPNPENIVVGACHFYYDPTHRNPLVPAVVEFIARQRGFAEAEIKRLNPYPDSYLLPEDSEMARRINRAFYGPQDFALIARKRHAD